jgi:hypothetical protein
MCRPTGPQVAAPRHRFAIVRKLSALDATLLLHSLVAFDAAQPWGADADGSVHSPMNSGATACESYCRIVGRTWFSLSSVTG